MRRFVLWAVALVIIFTFCGGGVEAKAGEALSVVCTIFPCYDLARAILPEEQHILLVKPGIETHAFEPTPQNILAMANADVLVYIGGENEAWVERVLNSIDTSRMKLVKLIDAVDTLSEHEDHGDHGEHGIDEHIWTNPLNLKKMAHALGETVGASEKVIGAYSDQCEELDMDFRMMVSGAIRRDVVFGDRFPFRYLFNEYGLLAHAAFANCTGESEPSARDIATLIDLVNKDDLSVIYKVDQSSDVVARTIKEATGAQVKTLFSAHNVTKMQFDTGVTCLSLLRENLTALKEGLF